MLHPVTFPAIHDSRKPVVMLKRDGDRRNGVLPLALEMRPHSRIQRDVNRDLVTKPDKFPWQRSHYVRKAS